MKLLLIRRVVILLSAGVDKLLSRQLAADTLKGIKCNVLIQVLSENYMIQQLAPLYRDLNSTVE